MKITFIGFNFGPTSSFTNGPGMSFYNFLLSIRGAVDADVFTAIPVEKHIEGISFFSIKDSKALAESISSSDFLHHWSGVEDPFSNTVHSAGLLGKKIICGPNVLDTVQTKKEERYLKNADIKLHLTVNSRLKHLLSSKYSILNSNISTFIVGPNLKEWAPSADLGTGGILWKGNCSHRVKDVTFALKVKEALPQYKFLFLGYPTPYKYHEHISVAKTAKLYINTSLSETKSQALMESWASGVPSVTHPKVYMHGANYETGIITNKTVKDYAEAIIEIMENDGLHKHLSKGALSYSEENFSEEVIKERYLDLLKRIE